MSASRVGEPRAPRAPLVEVVAIGAAYALVGLAVVTTYARIPLADLYNVSESGLAGGLGRALVYLNFPVAIAALAVIPIALDRLARSRAATAAGGVAAALCAVTALPGVVDQADLDAKPVNVVPALGVALVAWLVVVAIRRGGLAGAAPRRRSDAARIGLAVGLVVLSIPWLLAEVGVYVSDVPLLGRLFLGEELRPEEGHETLRAVHLGRHHGLDGTLLALTGLALSRVVPDLRRPGLRRLLALLVCALVVYGVLNAAQDAWLEQVVKRGWTETKLPSFLRPSLSWAWAGVLGATAATYAVVGRRLERAAPLNRDCPC